MPAAVVGYAVAAGAGATAIGAATAFTIGATAITVAQIAGAVASLAVSSAMADREQRKSQEMARASYNASLRDVTMIVDNPLVPRNIILGEARTSGPLWPWFTYGPLGQFHMFAVTLAGHECDSIRQHMFNEDVLTLDGSGNVVGPAKYVKTQTLGAGESTTGGAPGVLVTLAHTPATEVTLLKVDLRQNVDGSQIPTSRITNFTRLDDVTFLVHDDTTDFYVQASYSYVLNTPLFNIKSYLGAPGQAAAPELIAAALASGNPSAWDASKKNTGNCYVTIYMAADFGVLGDIGVPKYSAVVRGVKAYDERNGLTQWTQNPAVLARWFLVDCPYSPDTLPAEVRTADTSASAGVCEEGLAFSPSRFEVRYTCNGNLTCQEIPLSNLRHILDCMDGDAVFVAGQWQLLAGYYRPPTLTFDVDTLSEETVTVLPDAGKSDLFNAITGTFVSPAFGYQQVSYDQVTNAVYQAEDGDELLPQPMDFVCINDAIRCQMIAWQRLSRARNGQSIQLGTNYKGYDTAPLRNVNVLLPMVLGPDAKVMSVRQRTLDAPRLTYTLQETGPAVWAWDYTRATAVVDIADTSFPDILTVPVLSGLAAASGTAELIRNADGSVSSRIRATWGAVQNTYVQSGGHIQLLYREVAQPPAQWISAPAALGSDTQAYLYPVEDGKAYQIQGRCISSSGREGDWCPMVVHIVVGKTEPPPDVASFSISADGIATWSNLDNVADLSGYQIRWHPGNNISWGDATPMHQGLITNNPYSIGIRPSGVATFLIKAFDMSRTAERPLGNESVNAAASIINLGDPIVANVVTQYDYKAHGFPGAITNASVVGGNLVADADASPLAWDPNPDTNGWTLDTDPGWTLATYKPVTYVPDVFIVTPADDGVQLTLANAIAGMASLIEYRRDGDAPGWTSDAEPGWTDDADLAWATEAYRPWPGVVTARPGRYEWQVSIQSRDTQGVISALAPTLDVPDQFESLGQVSILAGGSVLPTAKTWRSVTGIGLTRVADGGTCRTFQIENREARLVTARDVTDVSVNGTAVATLQGY